MRGAQSKTGTWLPFLRGHIELQSVPCTQHVVRKLTVNFKKLTFFFSAVKASAIKTTGFDIRAPLYTAHH